MASNPDTRKNRARTTIAGVLCAALCAVAIPAAAAAADVRTDWWEAHITVRAQGSQQNLSFGMRSTATDGYDHQWDVPALRGSGVAAYFEHPRWPHGRFYHRDIRAARAASSFSFVVEMGDAERGVMRWDLRYVPVGCQRIDLYLTDETTGRRVDMRRWDDFEFASVPGHKRTYRIDVEVAQSEPPPAPPRAWLSGGSAAKVVRWEPSTAASIAGYQVYRKADGATWKRVSDSPVYEPVFVDASARSEGGATYLVKSLNYDFCESADGALAVGAPTHRHRIAPRRLRMAPARLRERLSRPRLLR